MTVTVEIPDSVARAFAPGNTDISRAVLEAMALEGYRGARLNESQIRRMLGFETRMEVHAFLKAHGAFMDYTIEDARRDAEIAASRGKSNPDEPFWKSFANEIHALPDKVFEKLPEDGASEHDHYLYGTPKRNA